MAHSERYHLDDGDDDDDDDDDGVNMVMTTMIVIRMDMMMMVACWIDNRISVRQDLESTISFAGINFKFRTC